MNLSAINKITAGKTRTSGISDFAELELSKVYANPEQPRKEFDTHLLIELAHDIETNGLLQPIVVVKRDNGYMIVSGERRYRAHKEFTSIRTIKAHIINADDSKVLELALIENIQREDLTDFEIAVHIGKLQASGNYSCKRDLAKAIGKSQSYLSKAFSCLKLDESIIKDIEEGKRDVGLSVLDEIARVKDKPMQTEVYRMYLSGFLTRDGIAEYRDLIMETPEVADVKPKVKKVQKKKWIINELDVSGNEEDGNSWYTTEAYLQYWKLNMPKDFPKETTPQRYKIIIEEI